MAKKSKAFGAKKKPTTSKPNPFDLKYVKSKQNVVGTSRYSNGNPLGTRKKAHEIRKNTIGKELKLMGKQNRIKDRRIGEKNPNLSDEQKAVMRFIAQRKTLLNKKKNKFLLTDEAPEEDSLEHLAGRLTEAEKFQRGAGHVENEEDDVDPELFAQASFGGGSLKPTKTDEEGRRLTRKEMLEQIISNSKQQKAIRQRDRQLQMEQWEKLDEQFGELKEAGELKFGRAKETNEDEDDDYMALYQQMEFDKKAPALDPRKDPVKQAELEQKRVEKAEAERQKRMNEGSVSFAPHVSVDEDADRRKRKRAAGGDAQDVQIRYDADGRPILKDAPPKGILKKTNGQRVRSADEEPEEEWPLDELEESDEEQDEELGSEDEFVEFEDDEEGGSELEDAEEVDDEEAAEGDSEGELDDQLEDEEEGGEEDEDEVEDAEYLERQPSKPKAAPPAAKKTRLQERVEPQEPPADGPVGRFAAEIKSGDFVERARLDELAAAIYQRAKFDTTKFAAQFRYLFDQLCAEAEAARRAPPTFRLLAFLRVTHAVFSVSDRVHAVCLPAAALAMETISRARIHDSLDCAKVLLLCNEMALWVEESKRYCPEVLALLHGVLMTATKNPAGQPFLSIGFPISAPHRQMLHLEKKPALKQIPPLSMRSVFTAENVESLNKNRQLDLQAIRLAETLEIVRKLVANRSTVRHLTQAGAKKIKMIEMLEPKIEEHFNARHPTHKRDDPKGQEKRLTKRLRRETRSAVKELRQDARFIAGVQHKERREVDEERVRKTNKILASLQTQESEYQKRKKTAKKF
ncbi:VWFA domain-containing protein [Aphelenchoides fujianensis]|nr:VWFA domain-containing protein [Aphelenchoides fujianensis]